MKKYDFSDIFCLKKKAITVVLSAILCICLFAPALSNPALCRAKAVLSDSNTTVEQAASLSMNTLYESTLTGKTTQYYCLSGQERAGFIRITIKTEEALSLSFRLFDHTGGLRSPSSYQYKPSQQLLQIKYFFSAHENYLLALHNLSSNTGICTIKYSAVKAASGQNKKESNKTTTLKATSKPKAKNTPKSKPQPHTKVADSSKSKTQAHAKPTSSPKSQAHAKPTGSPKPKPKSKPRTKTAGKKNNSAASKPQQPSTTITLSKTFLRVSSKTSFSLKAGITPSNGTVSCQWIVSNPAVLSGKNSKNTSSGSTFTAKACKKGTTIITCKTTGRHPVSASCTVKIV